MRSFDQTSIHLLLLSAVAMCGNLYAQGSAQNSAQNSAEHIKPNPVIVPLVPEIPKLPADITESSGSEIQPSKVEVVTAKPIAVPEYKKAKKEQHQNSD